MRFTIFLIFLTTTINLFGQISLFKDINTIEDGSYPSNFVELNGKIFFTVRIQNRLELWVTDGNKLNTKRITDKNLNYTSLFNTKLQVDNGFLYFWATKPYPSNGLELWRTNGETEEKLLDQSSFNYLYFINHIPYHISFKNNFYKIEEGQDVLVSDSLSNINQISWLGNPEYLNQEPILLQMESQFPSLSLSRLKIWKTNGTENGTVFMGQIDSVITNNFSVSTNNTFQRTFQIENQLFILIKRIYYDGNSPFYINIDLFKIDENTITLVKRINSNTISNFNEEIISIAKYKNKIIFNFDNKQLWISDGTTSGTYILRNGALKGDYNNKTWGFSNNKFYFSAAENNDFEIWESDGMILGTKLLKDINSLASSNPSNFESINGKVFFKANIDEVWTTNGTPAGTYLLKKLTFPINHPIDSNPSQYISASNGNFYFQNYDPINNFELWKCDQDFQNAELLNNINTGTLGSLNFQISKKAGKYWYFSGTDINGTELWKTDGTTEGTKMVKDISPLAQSTRIYEIVAMDTTVIFTATINNSGPKKLFKSDGREMGTVEIDLSNYTNIEPQELILIDSKLFFSGFDGISFGRILMTYDIINGNISSVVNNQYSPSSKISLGNKLIYASNGGLFVSDGTFAGSSQFSGGILSGPTNMKFPVEYNEKILFFSQGAFPTPDFSLYETDGTIAGTNQIKILGDYFMFSAANTLFSTKLNGKLIFSGHLNQNDEGTFLELWSTDGTNENTNKFTELKIENSSPTIINNYNIKYVKTENELFVFVKFYNTNLNKFMFKIYKTDGTNNGTQLILSSTDVDLPYEMTTFDGKIYFSTQNTENGYELWRSDGTSLGTYLVKDLNPGVINSNPKYFMPFENILLFWAFHPLYGFELHQYISNQCEANRNYTMQSGNWSDPNTWSCKHVPLASEIVIIKNPHKVNVPTNFKAVSNLLFTELGAVLDIPTGALVEFKAN